MAQIRPELVPALRHPYVADRDLPADLKKACRATLEELADADLLLHVVDASDPDHPQQIEAVEGILRELKRRRHYMKPSVKRRKKMSEAARRRRKRQKIEA